MVQSEANRSESFEIVEIDFLLNFNSFMLLLFCVAWVTNETCDE